jgi:lipoprotein-anchoring transpeptidase ErfK/SrfK
VIRGQLPAAAGAALFPAVQKMRLVRFALLAAAAAGLAACARDRAHVMRVSVADQKMALYRRGKEVARYDVSTSKFGLGDRPGSRATPLGRMEVAKKIGRGAPLGMKFKDRKPTGEIVPVNAPGRDPIVTRILWLKGLESQNRNTFGRTIYIHGTAEEWRIGTPASYGCIRMRSQDVVRLFNTVGVGARVEVTRDPLPQPAGETVVASAQ